MKVWIGEPAPQNTAWVYHPRCKTEQDAIDLIKTIEHYNTNAFMVELYSVDDMYWIKELNAAAATFERDDDIQFHINVHVHSNNQEVIDFINASPYLDYVPIVGV